MKTGKLDAKPIKDRQRKPGNLNFKSDDQRIINKKNV